MSTTIYKAGVSIFLICTSPFFLIAQSLNDYPHKADSSFQQAQNKKWRFGFDLSVYGSTIKGSQLNADYFAKPSVGLCFVANYRFVKFASLSIGAGYHQYGAGSITKIKLPVTGAAPDSTYRQRLRFNTFAFPISLNLRTPKDILKGWKIGGTFSVVPIVNVSSRDVYNSIEPTTRVIDVNKDVSSSYFKNDLMIQFAVGPEIAAGTGILKFQFVYIIGTANVYAVTGNGRNEAMGFRIGYLF